MLSGFWISFSFCLTSLKMSYAVLQSSFLWCCYLWSSSLALVPHICLLWFKIWKKRNLYSKLSTPAPITCGLSVRISKNKKRHVHPVLWGMRGTSSKESMGQNSAPVIQADEKSCDLGLYKVFSSLRNTPLPPWLYLRYYMGPLNKILALGFFFLSRSNFIKIGISLLLVLIFSNE